MPIQEAFVNHSWCHSPKVVSSYIADNINCIIIQAKTWILLRYISVYIVNVYIPPSSRIPSVDSFFNWLFWQLVCIVDTSFTIICVDFNRFNLQPVRWLGLTNVVSFSTRGHAALDHIFVSDSSCYAAKKRITLSSCDHHVLVALPRIHTKFNRRSFQMVQQKIIKVRDTSDENICLLHTALKETHFATFTKTS